MDNPIDPVITEASGLPPNPGAPSFAEALKGSADVGIESRSVSVPEIQSDGDKQKRLNDIVTYNNNLLMILLIHLLKQQQDFPVEERAAPIPVSSSHIATNPFATPTASNPFEPNPFATPTASNPFETHPDTNPFALPDTPIPPPNIPVTGDAPGGSDPSKVDNLLKITDRIYKNLQTVQTELTNKAKTNDVIDAQSKITELQGKITGLQENVRDLSTFIRQINNVVADGIANVGEENTKHIVKMTEENTKQVETLAASIGEIETQITKFTDATKVETLADNIEKLGKRLDDIQASMSAEGGVFQQFQSMASGLLSAGSGAVASGSSGAFKLPFSKSTPVINIRGTEFEIVELQPMTTTELQKYIVSLFPEMRDGSLEITLQNAAGNKLPEGLETKIIPITLIPKVPRGSTSEAYELLSNFMEAQYKSFKSKVDVKTLEMYTGIKTIDIPLTEFTSAFGTTGKPASYKYLYPPTPNIRVLLEMLATEQYFEIVDYLKKQGRDKTESFGIFTIGSPEGETLPSKDMILLYEKKRSIVPSKDAFIGTLPTGAYFVTAKATEIVEDIEGSPDSTNVVYIGGAPETALVRTKGKTIYLPFATAISQIFQRGVSIESIGLQTALSSLGLYYPYVFSMDKLKSFMEDVETSLKAVKDTKYGEFYSQTTVISALNVVKSVVKRGRTEITSLLLKDPSTSSSPQVKAEKTPFMFVINPNDIVQTDKDITETEEDFRDEIIKTYSFITRVSTLTAIDVDSILKSLRSIYMYLYPSLEEGDAEDKEYVSIQILIPDKSSTFAGDVTSVYLDRIVDFIIKILGYYKNSTEMIENLLEFIIVKLETIKHRSDGGSRETITNEINKIRKIVKQYTRGIETILTGLSNLTSIGSYKERNEKLNELLMPGQENYKKQPTYPMIRFEIGTKIDTDILLPNDSEKDIVKYFVNY